MAMSVLQWEKLGAGVAVVLFAIGFGFAMGFGWTEGSMSMPWVWGSFIGLVTTVLTFIKLHKKEKEEAIVCCILN